MDLFEELDSIIKDKNGNTVPKTKSPSKLNEFTYDLN
jgi:hypothetical protein